MAKVYQRYNIFSFCMIRAFIADFDRTVTGGDLVVDENCLSRIAELRQRGVHTSVVTGRKKSFMQNFIDTHRNVFDSVVCENGCVAYYQRKWFQLSSCEYFDRVIKRFSEEGIEFDHGECIISTEALSDEDAREILSGISGLRTIVNIDSVMILPAAVDKGTGIIWLQQRMNITKDETAGIGDGENDLVLRETCGYFGAPATAVEAVRAKADYVAKEEYSRGTAEFVDHLMEKMVPKY